MRSIFEGEPVVLAPMSGITDLPFRRLVRRLGVDLVVSEMVASAGLVHGTRLSRERGADDAAPRVIQLAGCEPTLMGEAARVAEDMGADVIDINMGCPMKKVVNGYAGSALMRDEDKALRIVEATVAGTSRPVTLKMRTGWDDDNRNAPRLARRAVASGVVAVSVHGRTRCQFFKGRADWRFIRQVKDAVAAPVIANGDLNAVEDARSMLAQSGADGVMVGRGSFGRPWFPGQVKQFLATGERLADPSLRQQRQIVDEHYDAMLSYYGLSRGMRIARKHLNAYLERLGIGREPRQQVLRCDAPAVVRGMLDTLYAERAQERAA